MGDSARIYTFKDQPRQGGGRPNRRWRQLTDTILRLSPAESTKDLS